MQTGIIKGIAVSALTLGLLAAVQTASAAPTGIANTKHNLGTGNLTIVNGVRTGGGLGLGDIFTTGTSEICVFCHTPHGANTTVPVPLWNKGSLPSTTYQTFTSGTMGGNGVPNAAPSNLAGHMSLACLSCHDGTQAMDNMINAPGSDGYNASGARLANSFWYNKDGSADGTDTLSGALNANPGGAGVFALGTDLSNDHPIGMKYAGGGCSTPGSTTACNDQDFNAASNGLNGFYQVNPTGVSLAGDKRAMRLYNTNSGVNLADATVECASCHDPHSDAQNTFLRVSNAGSGVCLTCHAK